MSKKSNGIRSILIYALTRQQLIDFIKRKDDVYQEKHLTKCSDDQLRDIAHDVDRKVQERRYKLRK
ncbi:MAG: hypothetical protein HY840_00650 [Bacteroidetes bacterium]|nr:hypothetical protein [Bacteroidota bacterium]